MDLGGLEQFEYEPKFRGNRNLPQDERISVTVRRMSAVEVLSLPSDSKLIAWRNETFREWAVTEKEAGETTERIVGFKGIAEGLEDVSLDVLMGLRRACRHTHGWKRVTVDGRPISKPEEIFLYARIPNDTDQLEQNLLGEIVGVLNSSSTMTDQQIEDFSKPSDGGTNPTTVNATGAEEGEHQRDAGILEVDQES
tara:strand:+ start:1422 stop:2009 length:588 start_codon:yes stop_codon:yes gene_type:complete